MINVKSLDQLEQERKQEEARKAANYQAMQQQAPVIDSLAKFVRSKWETAKAHKLQVTERLTDCLRRRKGEYSPTKRAQIEATGGSDIYMNITGTKCVGAKAWLSDLFASDRPYTLSPTPVASLPPELHQQLINEAMMGAMQLGVTEQDAYALLQQHKDRIKQELDDMAEQRMEKMSDYIDDVLTEGRFRHVFDEFLDDLTTYPTAIISGVNFRQRKKMKWVEINGKHVPKKELTLSREFSRVSPFDAYPAPTMDAANKTWFIEHVRYTPETLANMRKAKGYNADAIYRVLSDYRINGRREWLFNTGERDRLEGKNNTWSSGYDLIDGIKYTGSVQGTQLIEWGMNPQSVPDPMDEYMVNVVVIGEYTIRALINPDPSNEMDYFFCSFRQVPNSFWGQSLPETIADTQDACNATARSLINNMAMGSGPMVSYDVSQMPVGGRMPKIKPWGLIAYDGTKGGGRQAGVNFFMPEIKANELLGVYERFSNYADEQSGIPKYAMGSDGGAGAAKTASGLSMLMNASSKTMKNIVRTVDINIIEPLIRKLYNTLMVDPDVPEDVKGDAQVKARGSDSLMHKESAAMRQQELLGMTGNPIDMQIFGINGRRQMYHELLKNTDMPADKILPSEEELQQQQMQQMQMQQQQLAGQPQNPQGNQQ